MTVMVAAPEVPPTLAVAVFAKTPIVPPAVKTPDWLIVPPPAATDHVGEMFTTCPAASYPVATSCCVPVGESVAFGVTVMRARVPASEGPCTSHAEANPAANMTAATVRALLRIRLMLNIDPPAAYVTRAHATVGSPSESTPTRFRGGETHVRELREASCPLPSHKGMKE